MVERIQREWGLTLGKVVAVGVYIAGFADTVSAMAIEVPTIHQNWFDIPGPDPLYDVALMVVSAGYVVFGRNPKR